MTRRIMKTIGIIGAGAAGLCSARHALAISGMVPIIWEQSSRVGGTWVFTPEIGKDKFGLPIHSSMYRNLKTNLPKEVMAFPDYPFPEGEESFLHHTKVCKYLEDYCEHFKIEPCIQFNHHVEKVSPVMREEGPPSWSVTVTDLLTNRSSTTTCDALLVCNGHYSVPKLPNIENIERFKGRKVHSHYYREPLHYKDKTVVVLGAAASGLDICLEVSTVAKKVFLSHNHPVEVPSEFPSNVEQVRGVVGAIEKGFVLKDWSKVEADVIIYCTGYEFSFPFLTEECGVRVEDNIVKPLYKHLIHSTYPSMAFIGIPFLICPFPLFDYQVQCFIASLTGKLKLPSSQEMAAIMEDEIKKKNENGFPDKHYHMFGLEGQQKFMEETVKEIGCKPMKPYFARIMTFVMMRLIFDFTQFKFYTYNVDCDGNINESKNGEVVYSKLELLMLGVKGIFRLLRRDFCRVVVLLRNIIYKKFQRMLRT